MPYLRDGLDHASAVRTHALAGHKLHLNYHAVCRRGHACAGHSAA
jgi:hypothetical protein